MTQEEFYNDKHMKEALGILYPDRPASILSHVELKEVRLLGFQLARADQAESQNQILFDIYNLLHARMQ